MKTFDKYGVSIPNILLPKNIDLSTWSVIACDQYTQDKAYWEKAAQISAGKPSTLNLIFPEVFLGGTDKDERIKKIQDTMKAYIDDGVFEDEAENMLENALCKLAEKGTDKDGNTFLFAVGDGNHSLATAKAVWEEHKANLSPNSPVRYALVEIVNIYDKGLTFEPIHRVLFGLNSKELLQTVSERLNGKIIDFSDAKTLENAVAEKTSDGARYGFIFKEGEKTVCKMIQTSISDLAIAALQPVLDDYMTKKGADKTQIDYIHGSDEVIELGQKADNTGILLPPIAKDSFFATINGRGPLPRKSFSMGEASEKRFYVESRRLF